MEGDDPDSPSTKQPPPLELLRIDIDRDPIEDNTMKQPPSFKVPCVDFDHDPIDAKLNTIMPPTDCKLTDRLVIQSNDESPQEMLTFEANSIDVPLDGIR